MNGKMKKLKSYIGMGMFFGSLVFISACRKNKAEAELTVIPTQTVIPSVTAAILPEKEPANKPTKEPSAAATKEPTVTPKITEKVKEEFLPVILKDGKEMQIDEDGTTLFIEGESALTVTGVSKLKSDSITIPSKVDDKIVTGIASGAFSDCDAVKKISLPDTLSFIEEGAFSGCYQLKTVAISDSNQSFCTDDGVLFDAAKEVLIAYPAGKKEKSYEIPKGTKEISAFAFSDASCLTSVIISDSMVLIGEYAFSDCYELKKVILPESVAIIQEGTFTGCENLGEVIIKGELSNIGYAAFSNCTTLASIEFRKKIDTIDEMAFAFCPGLHHVVIPEGASQIKDMAFYHCYGLTKITIPPSVLFMGEDVFAGAKGLTVFVKEQSYAKQYAVLHEIPCCTQ